ncbi:MAG: hypothetical protein Q9170_000677 [Blastenia crenularia]
MRLLLCLPAVAFLQILLYSSGSIIPTPAQALPQEAPTYLENKSLLLLPPTKRAWPDHRHTFFVLTRALGSDWFLRFNVLEYVSPSSIISNVAARDLVQFYSATLAIARVLWAHDQPKTVRRAAFNGMLLIFWSDQPIAWEFLNSFFEHIIERTQGGLVGGYEVTCVAEITGVVVNVALSLPGSQMLAAPAAKKKLS